MSPLKPLPKDDKRIQAILDTATLALQHLRDRTPVTPSLANDIDTHIKQISTLSAASVAKRAKELDICATDIWNATASVLFGGDEPDDPRLKTPYAANGVLLRVFALLLLETAHSASSRRANDPGQRMRLFSVANRTAKLCLDRHRLDLSMTALEIGSNYMPQPAESTALVQFDGTEEQHFNDHELGMKSLEREYYLLRIFHAWSSERHDLADHFYQSWAKVCMPASVQAVDVSIKAADLFYEMARQLTESGSATATTKWYDRALASLQDQGEGAGYETDELLISIAVAYVEELLRIGRPTSLARAQDIMAQLESSHRLGNRTVVPVLRLRILAHVQHVGSEEIRRALVQIIRLAVLTEENFRMIMQTARKAYELDAEVTISALQIFVLERILPEIGSSCAGTDQVSEWLEKAAVTCTLYATTHMISSGKSHVHDLEVLYDRIQERRAGIFTTKATHAAQTLIWKATNVPDGVAARGCCQLLRHPLFDNAGNFNKGRIGRKVMGAALDLGELAIAREAFLAMPGTVQNEPGTRYLAFKLALRQFDDTLATESLRMVVNSSASDSTYLYACVLDAQQQPNMRHIAVLALRAVLDCRPPGLQLGSLLRCMARLLMSEVNCEGAELANVSVEIIAIFEMAANCIQDIRKCPPEQWHAEAQWWSKNAYNKSIELCSAADPRQLLRLLSACMTFLDNYPDDSGLTEMGELAKRKSLCLVLSTTALLVLGRSDTHDGQRAEDCFLKAQQTIAAFKEVQQTTDHNNNDDKSWAFAMVKFELECILRLRQWNILDTILRSCLDMRITGRWDTLADLMIIIHEHLDASEREAHTSLITQLLQKIINETWKTDKDIVKVSRWLRFAFVLCLNHEEGDFARKLLEQASRMAESGQQGKYELYPEAELQWLATTGFNHAIDLIADVKLGQVTAWLEVALNVARWCQDNGALHAILTTKRKAVEERMKSVSE